MNNLEKMTKLRIAMVGPYPLDPYKITGGIQAVNYNLVKGLRNFEDLDLHVINVDFDQEIESSVEEGITLHYLRSSKKLGQITLYNGARKWIVNKIKEIDPHIVHVHGTDMYGFALRKLEYPTLLTVHGILSQEAKIFNPNSGLGERLYQRIKGLFNSYFERSTLQSINHIIVISPYVKKMIEEYTAAKMYYIDNPIDERFFQLENKTVNNRLLFVGMIRARKGILNLLKAINEIRHHIPDVCLHIIGKVFEPEYEKILKEYMEQNQLNENVIFRGRLDEKELYQEFEECAILILPSIEESSPMVIEQAMAVGKAVVATRVGGIPHLVQENVTGLLVNYGDVQGLVEQISRLLLDSEKRIRMGIEAKKEAEKRFKLSAIVKKTRLLYFEIVNSRSKNVSKNKGIG